MKPSLIRSYLLISLGVTSLFILLGAFVIQVIDQINHRKFENNPPMFFSQLIDNSPEQERTKIFNQMKGQNFPFDAWLFEKDGKVRESSTSKALPIDLDKINLPEADWGTVIIEKGFWHRQPPIFIIKLHGKFAQYLVFAPKSPDIFFGAGRAPPGPMPGMGDHMVPPMGPPPGIGQPLGPPPGPPPDDMLGRHRGTPFLFPIIIFIVAILLASGVSVAILFTYLKQTSILADSVLDRLKNGNLKARFPIKKMNEIGNLMYRFNLMADEVEVLFEKLKNNERSRTRLLQDLAHDLRTPIASMQNMLALLGKDNQSVPETAKLELVTMSQKEANYIGTLVNDLLLLSQISEPESLPKKFEPFDLTDLIEAELETIEAQNMDVSQKIKLINRLPQEPKIISGDPHLIKRLFRNLFDNAFSFAKTQVVVSFKDADGKFEVLVQDDGPGFSPEALKNYGERRTTRSVEHNTEGRISVGLGSVIVKAVAHVHGANVIPSNILDSEGKSTGSQVRVIFSNG